MKLGQEYSAPDLSFFFRCNVVVVVGSEFVAKMTTGLLSCQRLTIRLPAWTAWTTLLSPLFIILSLRNPFLFDLGVPQVYNPFWSKSNAKSTQHNLSNRCVALCGILKQTHTLLQHLLSPSTIFLTLQAFRHVLLPARPTCKGNHCLINANILSREA